MRKIRRNQRESKCELLSWPFSRGIVSKHKWESFYITRCILDFEHSRNQRQGSEYFFMEMGFPRCLPNASLANGA